MPSSRCWGALTRSSGCWQSAHCAACMPGRGTGARPERGGGWLLPARSVCVAEEESLRVPEGIGGGWMGEHEWCRLRSPPAPAGKGQTCLETLK